MVTDNLTACCMRGTVANTAGCALIYSSRIPREVETSLSCPVLPWLPPPQRSRERPVQASPALPHCQMPHEEFRGAGIFGDFHLMDAQAKTHGALKSTSDPRASVPPGLAFPFSFFCFFNWAMRGVNQIGS